MIWILVIFFDFLLSNKVSYWQAISRSKVKSSDKISEEGHIFWFLYQLQTNLTKVLDLLPQLVMDPRVKVVEDFQIKTWNDSLNVDESSINWLLHNFHVIARTDPYNSSRIKINNRFYGISQIQSSDLITSTDIYENQIIHGYLQDVKEYLINILANITNNIVSDNDFGLTLREIQINKYFLRLKTIVYNLTDLVDELIYKCNKIIPVSSPKIEWPSIFYGFESKDHYYQIGVQIISWFDRKNFKFDNHFLFSGVRTLDKLYELFCLYKIINAIVDLGYEYNEFAPSNFKINNKWDDRVTAHAGRYSFKKLDGCSITLNYEYVPKYLFTSSSLYKGQLLPDFILEIRKPGVKDINLVILDAKYKPFSNIKRFDLAELTLKYLHGISSDINSINFKGLFLLHPKDKVGKDNTKPVWSYHQEEFDLFSLNPIYPSIGTVEVGVSKKAKSYITDIINIFQNRF
ncbi:hypothetical protein AHMF7605_06810 [Adhaeribacter arboris]|uniref:DUF2357 domain-containing protein n=1 Tax=Adhaeribacter arboris TaxID=2072846 RepID=A0A2T2YCL2_9BACT|nr:nuclease domain-containing protein [Adhaeribacter arboris]PSR53260.1 hypothetical protein AHMF7605_06810 [Adhaeribacter arboris]